MQRPEMQVRADPVDAGVDADVVTHQDPETETEGFCRDAAHSDRRPEQGLRELARPETRHVAADRCERGGPRESRGQV